MPVLIEVFLRTIPRSRKIISTDEIIQIVSDYCRVPVKDIKTRIQKHEIVQARYLCMYFMRHYTALSLKSIGKQFNEVRYDHTTVVHGISSVYDMLKNNEQIKDAVARIDKAIQQKL